MRPKSIDRPAEKRAAVRSVVLNVLLQLRSEERRVGKEC